ncbi:MAG: AI-2E family transporter [Tagaea sp.]
MTESPQREFPWGRLVAWLLILGGIGIAIYALSAVLLPFLVGMAVAYLLDPAVDRAERAGVPRAIGAAGAPILFFVAVGVAVALLAPVLQTQLFGLAERLAVVVRHTVEWARPYIEDLLEQIGHVEPQQFSGAGDAARQVFGWLARAAGGVLSGGLAIVNLLSLLFITPVVSFYLIRDWNKVVSRIDSWLPRDHAEDLRDIAREVDARMAGFLRGQALVCLFLAVFYATGLTLAGLSYGLLVGLLTGLLSFVPYVGVTVGMATGLAIAFYQFPDWLDVGLVLAVFVAGQVLEGSVVTPKLVGDRVGLHPVWMILAILAGASLFGFTGVILAVPTAAAIGVLLRYGLKRYLASSLYLGRGK